MIVLFDFQLEILMKKRCLKAHQSRISGQNVLSFTTVPSQGTRKKKS